VVLLVVSVKCIILSMIEDTMMERRRENTVVKQMRYASMGPWAAEQLTVGATDHSFVHSHREVKFGVVPKASETFGYQTLDGWPSVGVVAWRILVPRVHED
jgi:hypothetical protein